jgi:hypothetical protein
VQFSFANHEIITVLVWPPGEPFYQFGHAHDNNHQCHKNNSNTEKVYEVVRMYHNQEFVQALKGKSYTNICLF